MGPDVAALKGVVVVEHVLDADVPGDGLRPDLVGHVAAGIGDGVRLAQRPALALGGIPPPARKPVPRLPPTSTVVCGLRRKSEQTLVVVEHVVEHAKTGAN